MCRGDRASTGAPAARALAAEAAVPRSFAPLSLRTSCESAGGASSDYCNAKVSGRALPAGVLPRSSFACTPRRRLTGAPAASPVPTPPCTPRRTGTGSNRLCATATRSSSLDSRCCVPPPSERPGRRSFAPTKFGTHGAWVTALERAISRQPIDWSLASGGYCPGRPSEFAGDPLHLSRSSHGRVRIQSGHSR